MSTLFIFRHTVELFLKQKLTAQLNTHSIGQLYKLGINHIYPDFITELDIITKDEDGSCFKYLSDKNGQKYFIKGQSIQSLSAFTYFFRLIGESVENISKKREKAFFELYPSDYTTLGQIQTDYDSSTSELVVGIIEHKIKLEDIFFPLMFLVRHSIELSLKANLRAADMTTSNEIINTEHSLYKLFTCFDNEVQKALQQMNDNPELKKETLEYHQKFENLKQIIHNVDAHSFYFRYPVDKNGKVMEWHNIKRDYVLKALTLATTADAYISWAIPVLQHYEYLPSGTNQVNCN
jgi:hypothetical protein